MHRPLMLKQAVPQWWHYIFTEGDDAVVPMNEQTGIGDDNAEEENKEKTEEKDLIERYLQDEEVEKIEKRDPEDVVKDDEIA